MSGYSGGVSITQVSAFNSNPNSMSRGQTGKLSIYGSSNLTTYDSSANPTEFFAVAKGANGLNPVLPANVSSITDLCNETGAGFIGAIWLPKFVAMGAVSVRIAIDSVVRVFNLNIGPTATYRGLFMPDNNLQQWAGDAANPSIPQFWPVLDTVRIKPIGSYIADGSAIRVESGFRVSVTSAVATDATSPCLVQFLKDMQ